MIERRCRLGFALEAAARRRVGNSIRQEFDRDGTMQPGIERPIDDAHAAGTDGRLHLIDADHAAGHRRRADVAHGVGSDGERRDGEDVEGRGLVR